MNSDLNIATRRLLQVVLDMLSNPDYARLMEERAAAKAKNERVYDPPSLYRCDPLAVEAAFRAATEAQQMLREAAIDMEIGLVPKSAPFIVGAPTPAPVSPEVYKTTSTCASSETR